MIHGAIFDMDGTLTDSMHLWQDIGARYLLSLGLTPPENLNNTIGVMTMEEVSNLFTESYGIKKTPQEIRNEINLLLEPLYEKDVLPKSGVIELLELLKGRGVKMCVATATDRHLAEIALETTGLIGYFSEIFTCTMVGDGKEKPTIYEKSLEHLGTEKSDTLVFEDALYAVETAKSAGFVTVGVYDKFSKWAQERIQDISDIYLPDYSPEHINVFK
ncbi:MAG: HAD family phosphatase [Clostridiales bacterium]|nr:HAD family phosphatase [Clostridiales bacterium]